MLMGISIFQWNARSLISNGQELKCFIEELSVKPNVICVQETWLKPSLDFIIHGYTAVRKDRSHVTGGGVATFVQQGIDFRAINSDVQTEVVIVEIWTNRGKIKVANLYNPCQKLTKVMLEGIWERGNGKVIICGDFNAHSSL